MKKIVLFLSLIATTAIHAAQSYTKRPSRTAAYFTFDVHNIVSFTAKTIPLTDLKHKAELSHTPGLTISVTPGKKTEKAPSLSPAPAQSKSFLIAPAPHYSHTEQTAAALPNVKKAAPAQSKVPFTALKKSASCGGFKLKQEASAHTKQAHDKKKCSPYALPPVPFKKWTPTLKPQKASMLKIVSITDVRSSIEKLDSRVVNHYGAFSIKPTVLIPYVSSLEEIVSHAGVSFKPITGKPSSLELAKYALELGWRFTELEKRNTHYYKNGLQVCALLDSISRLA